MRGLLFFALFLCIQVAHAQLLLDSVELESIPVVGKRHIAHTALSKTVVGADVLAAGYADDMAKLIGWQTPVYVRQGSRGGGAQASVRGAAASHTQVVWNGLPINSSQTGVADFSLMPAFFADEASLLAGAASVSEASGALGGAIVINNKPNWRQPYLAAASFSAGSFDTYAGKAQARVSGAGWQYGLRLGADISENNFPFFNSGVLPKRMDTLRHGRYEKAAMLHELYLLPGEKTELSFYAWGHASNRELPPVMSSSNLSVETQNEKALRLAARLRTYAGRWQIGGTAGFINTAGGYTLQAGSSGWMLTDIANRENTAIAKLSASRTSRKGGLSAAGEAGCAYYKAASNNAAYGKSPRYDASRTELSGKLSARARLLPQTYICAISSMEAYGGGNYTLVPYIGAEQGLPFLGQTYLHISAARNYHKPSLNDLYFQPGGNEHLRPEKGYTADAKLQSSIKRRAAEISGSLAAYASVIQDWIIWEPSAQGAYYHQAQNIGRVYSRGAEASACIAAAAGKWKISATGQYSLTIAENTSQRSPNDRSGGKQLIYTPRNAAGTFAGIERGHFWLRLSHSYTGLRHTRSDNSAIHALPAYNIADAELGAWAAMGSTKASLSLRAENLLKARYTTMPWRPMPLRHYMATLKFEISPRKVFSSQQ
jgi:outer membrane cobalamin receptor